MPEAFVLACGVEVEARGNITVERDVDSPCVYVVVYDDGVETGVADPVAVWNTAELMELYEYCVLEKGCARDRDPQPRARGASP